MSQSQTIAAPGPAPEYTTTTIEIPVRTVRCSCEQCGAHTNALWSFRLAGSCPTCGSFRLVPVAGAEAMATELAG